MTCGVWILYSLVMQGRWYNVCSQIFTQNMICCTFLIHLLRQFWSTNPRDDVSVEPNYSYSPMPSDVWSHTQTTFCRVSTKNAVWERGWYMYTMQLSSLVPRLSGTRNVHACINSISCSGVEEPGNEASNCRHSSNWATRHRKSWEVKWTNPQVSKLSPPTWEYIS